MMKGLRRAFIFLALLIGLSSIPLGAFALPGQIAWYSGGTLMVQNGRETIYATYPTGHSPIRYANNERRYKVHFDNYRYKIRNSGSKDYRFAISKITPSSPDGQSMYDMVFNTSSSYSNYLDGDYYLYMYDYTGNTNNLSLSQMEIVAETPGLVYAGGPGAFYYTNGYESGPGSAYILRGSTHQITAWAEGNPISVVATVTTSSGTTTLGTLSPTGWGGNYSMNYTFNDFYDPRGTQKPTLNITVTYPNSYAGPSKVVVSEQIYVTLNTLSEYQHDDSTFYYNSLTDNSFVGPANDDLMCYDYIVDNRTLHAAGAPNQGYDNDIIDFMKRQGRFASRPGGTFSTASTTIMPYVEAIYYPGYHFAKVTKWDASGNPIEIISKWGPRELIRSQSAYSLGYGAPHLYFKR
ncbi:hypothetical protein [Paenibacillus sp. NPDC058174]|uniref:hypothetical protein n=1 Tax=Paenibacillus sp. NPDC058174 TaxID=3346366 RepID=UPI0036DB1891